MIATVSVGSTSTPEPASRTTALIPGRSDTTAGTPAAIASNSLFGVVSRWLSVSPWIGMPDDVGAGDPVVEIGRRDRAHHPDATAERRIRLPGAERRLEDAVAHQHERRVGDVADGLDELLDAAPREQPAVVEDHPLAGGQPERLVEAALPAAPAA